MKNIIIICLSLMIAIFGGTGCTTTKKYMQIGNYDAAIKKAARKLRKNPNNQKQLMYLEQSYSNANNADQDRINFLNKEGSPDRWKEIFDRYRNMKSRQTLVKSLAFPPPSIQFVDYDAELIEAKRKAAAFFYARGQENLKKPGKANARSAWYDFRQVSEYYPNYQDVNSKLTEAKSAGMEYAMFQMKNHSGIPLPAGFVADMTRISLNDLNQEWLQFHTNETQNTDYDYLIMLNMKVIDVSPERISERERTETREVTEEKPVLGNDGKPRYDANGKPMVTVTKKTVNAQIFEIVQSKQCIISGHLDFLNQRTNQVLKTDPINAQHVFENVAVTLKSGDKRALSDIQIQGLGLRPVAFPPDPTMILQTAATLKTMTRDIIARNRGVLR